MEEKRVWSPGVLLPNKLLASVRNGGTPFSSVTTAIGRTVTSLLQVYTDSFRKKLGVTCSKHAFRHLIKKKWMNGKFHPVLFTEDYPRFKDLKKYICNLDSDFVSRTGCSFTSNFTIFTVTESSSPALPVGRDGVHQCPCLRWHQCSGSCAAGLKINLTTEKNGVFFSWSSSLNWQVLCWQRGAAMNGWRIKQREGQPLSVTPGTQIGLKPSWKNFLSLIPTGQRILLHLWWGRVSLLRQKANKSLPTDAISAYIGNKKLFKTIWPRIKQR